MGSFASGISRMFTPPTPPGGGPAPPGPPSLADPSIAAVGARTRARLAARGGMGFGDTLKTGAGGVPKPATTNAALTGGTS